MRTQKKMLKCCFSNLNKASQLIPYNFLGVSPPEVLSKPKANNVESFMNAIDKELKSSFKIAYRGLIESLKEWDMEFLGENTEGLFYEKLKKLNKEEDLKIVELGEEEVKVVEIGIFLGRKLNRNENPLYFFKSGFSTNEFLNVYFFYSNIANINGLKKIPAVFQIPVYFKGGIQIFKDEVDLKRSSLWHKVVFEKEGCLEFKNYFQIFRKLGNPNILQDIFYKKYSEWKVSDIDDYLDGNSFLML